MAPSKKGMGYSLVNWPRREPGDLNPNLPFISIPDPIRGYGTISQNVYFEPAISKNQKLRKRATTNLQQQMKKEAIKGLDLKDIKDTIKILGIKATARIETGTTTFVILTIDPVSHVDFEDLQVMASNHDLALKAVETTSQKTTRVILEVRH